MPFLTDGEEDLTYRKRRRNGLKSQIGAPERLSLRLHDLDPQAWLPPSAYEDSLRIVKFITLPYNKNHKNYYLVVKTD